MEQLSAYINEDAGGGVDGHGTSRDRGCGPRIDLAAIRKAMPSEGAVLCCAVCGAVLCCVRCGAVLCAVLCCVRCYAVCGAVLCAVLCCVRCGAVRRGALRSPHRNV